MLNYKRKYIKTNNMNVDLHGLLFQSFEPNIFTG